MFCDEAFLGEDTSKAIMEDSDHPTFVPSTIFHRQTFLLPTKCHEDRCCLPTQNIGSVSSVLEP